MRNNFELTKRSEEIKKRIEKHGEHLYHYTSLDALCGILKNKELWLSNTSNMNDKAETTDFLQRLWLALLDNLDTDKRTKCNNFFDSLYKRIDGEYPFAMCFSTLEDNAAQWERYADNAKGICNVFNTFSLESLFINQFLLFEKIFYFYDVTKHDHYKTLFKYFNTDKLEGFSNETSLMDNILACAYLRKHPSFSTESEIRLVTLWNEILNEYQSDFINRNGVIKNVIKVSLSELCEKEGIVFEDLIDQIIIGPRSSQSIHEFRKYIRHLGLDKIADNIVKSNCPLR